MDKLHKVGLYCLTSELNWILVSIVRGKDWIQMAATLFRNLNSWITFFQLHNYVLLVLVYHKTSDKTWLRLHFPANIWCTCSSRSFTTLHELTDHTRYETERKVWPNWPQLQPLSAEDDLGLKLRKSSGRYAFHSQMLGLGPSYLIFLYLTLPSWCS